MSLLHLFLFGFLAILSQSPLTNAFINVGDSSSSSSSSDEDDTVESSNGLDESNDESLYTFSYAESIELKQGQFIGRVTIGESFSLSFDLELSGQHGDYWASILHIGSTNAERSPGIWLYPNELELHIRFSDINDYNTGYDVTETLSLDTVYNVKLTVTADGSITSYLDDAAKATTHGTVFLSRYEAPIFVGDPWYYPAIGNISNIEIGPYDGEMYVKEKGKKKNIKPFIVSEMELADDIDAFKTNEINEMNSNKNKKNIGQIIERTNKENKMDNFGDFSMFWKIVIISGAVFLSVSLFLIANCLVMNKHIVGNDRVGAVRTGEAHPYTTLL